MTYVGATIYSYMEIENGDVTKISKREKKSHYVLYKIQRIQKLEIRLRKDTLDEWIQI